MAFRLKWSDEALNDLFNIKSYVTSKFGDRIWLKFLVKLSRYLSLISNNPESFQLFPNYSNIRKCTVSNRCAIFFKLEEDEVRIMTLFDFRQDPEKLKEILEE